MTKTISLPEITKDVSVVIINYKTPSLLRQCIKSIQKSTPQASSEIIVVDNASEDESIEIMEDEFPDVRLIASPVNVGFPRAVNMAIRESHGHYVLILNPDITILKDSIDSMMRFLETRQDVGMVGARLMNPNGSIQRSCFSFFTTPSMVVYRRTFLGKSEKAKRLVSEFLMDEWDHSTERPVAWVLGSCMMVRRSAIEDIGLMDERFFMYMEDVDWCRRLWKKGWKVYYYPHAEMVHYYQRSSATEASLFLALFNRQTRIHIMSAIAFFAKYFKDKAHIHLYASETDNTTAK